MKKIAPLLVLILFLASFTSIPTSTQAAINVQGVERSLQNAISSGNWTNAAIYSKQLAVHFDEIKQYDRAAAYYDDSAAYWAKAGHADWGVQDTIRADEIRSVLSIYVEKPVLPNKTLAKFEPLAGTYLGFYAAGVRDDSKPEVVESIYGRNHAMYLTYTHWGQKYSGGTNFRMDLAQKAKSLGSAIQVAWEPSGGLDTVVDNEYVRQFAREAKESGVPVFLRFAGEMNGDWVPWGGNPEKYKEKFKLIHDIMAEEAPNVAMVWAPNFLPRHNWDEYYPGDQYVDWVGVSLYTVPFSQKKENLGVSPIDNLRPVYEKYSHKPMMIVEGAVSHYSYGNHKDYSQWAVSQIGNMYGFLPRMFPQLKAITYFNWDTSGNEWDAEKNNYDLGGSAIVDQAYQRMIQNPNFIDTLSINGPYDQVKTEYVSVDKLKEASGVHHAFVYAKLPLGQQPYYVAVYQGKNKLGEAYAQPWDMKIDFSLVNPAEALTVTAYNQNFQPLSTRTVKVSFTHVDKFGQFSDVKETHWAFKEIERAAEEGIVNGYPDGSFRPNQKVTTAEFVTMLARAYGKGNDLQRAPYPKGVADFMNRMNYPYGAKISTSINRSEVAEIISGTQGRHFNGEDSIKFLLVKGLSKGKDPQRISVEGYRGTDTLTRAEAVTFIANVKKSSEQVMKERPSEPSDTTTVRSEYQQKFE